MRERCRERERKEKREEASIQIDWKSLAFSEREKREKRGRKERERSACIRRIVSSVSHRHGNRHKQTLRWHSLSLSFPLLFCALEAARARAREKHVTPNKVISDTKEKTRTSAQMVHSKSLGISSPKLIDRAWCAFIIISAFADCSSSSSRCWCSSKCDGAMPIVVQREVVVFLVFFSVRVENIFDENTKYCRFLTHASHVFNFKYVALY